MKAAPWHGARDIRVQDITEPSPQPGQVKIKVAWTGISGSDLPEYLAGPITIPPQQKHRLSNDKAPIVMGHEHCGEIVELGEGVNNFAVGDRVATEPIYACGEFTASRDVKYNLCEKLGFMGLSAGIGGFAAYAVVPVRTAYKMPDGLTLEEGALLEPAAVALHAVRQTSMQAGDKAAVFGTGPIGLLVVEALRIAGASEIYVVEPSEIMRQMALDLGAKEAFDPTAMDPVEAILDRTQGGVHVAFEVTGLPSVLPQAIDATRYEGQTSVVSIRETEASFHPNTVVIRERDIEGTIAYRNLYPSVMALMEQRYFFVDRLVSKRIALDDIVTEGFETLVSEKSQEKILVAAP